jgi:hypothetical protein
MDAGALPRDREFRRLNFTVITEKDGWPEWVEIKTPEQADFVRRASSTQVDAQFDAERRDNEGRPAPHRWFMLTLIDPFEGTVQANVVVAVPGPGWRLRQAVRHVAQAHSVGFAGANPYPDFRDEIYDLARATNITIEPNFAGLQIESKTPRLYALLNSYGAAKFADGWRPERFGGLGGVADLARRVGLLDEDADFFVSEMRWYGEETFGAEWTPLEADTILGKEQADELRGLFAWIEASNELKMNSSQGL